MNNEYQLILIFVSVMIGVISAAYFYVSAGIFMDFLKWPIKLVAGGMFIITIGVLLAAFISYEAGQGANMYLYGYPLSALFYILYILGSLLIAFGASRFRHKARSVASAV